DGTTVTGTTEPNADITVYDEDDNVIGTGTADSNGNYTVTLDTPLANGEAINVTATDADENESVPATVNAPSPDITAVDDLDSAEQTIDIVEGNLNDTSGSSFALANVG